MPRSSADTRAAKNWSVLYFLLAAAACTTHRAGLSLPNICVDNATPGWVDLLPGMELKVDGAYYREGSPRRSLADYLGDEIANYEIRENGSLDLKSVSSLPVGKQPPRDQPAIQLLIGRRNASSRYHRLFFRVVLSQTGSPWQEHCFGDERNHLLTVRPARWSGAAPSEV
jgi:hypothetical protein